MTKVHRINQICVNEAKQYFMYVFYEGMQLKAQKYLNTYLNTMAIFGKCGLLLQVRNQI